MSSNRLIYDSCAYKKNLQQSTDPLNYVLYTGKYENSAKCRIELGSVGGNGVSLFNGNLVDLESDLRGQTRQTSLCPNKKYGPNSNTKCNDKNKEDCKPKLNHQPSCQMINYPKVPTGNKFKNNNCDFSKYN